MLVRTHDAPLNEAEWKGFLRSHDFGQLIAPGLGRKLPIVVPAHFVYHEEQILLHLAKSNPVLPPLRDNPGAMFSVIGAYTYVTAAWNRPPDASWSEEFGIPTSYYAAVQLDCRAEIVDDPAEVAEILNLQVAHFEPNGGLAAATPENEFGTFLAAIRGIRLHIGEVRAKFKFGGNRTPEHQIAIATALVGRGRPADIEAAEIQLLRLASTLP